MNTFTFTNPMTSHDEKVETVDIEQLGRGGDIFEQQYGSKIMNQANAQRTEMEKRFFAENGGAQSKPSTKEERQHARQPSIGFVNKGMEEVDTNARLSYFEKEKVYPNEWTDSCLNMLEFWASSCRRSSEAHANAARSCRRKHRMVSIPTIVLATAATSASFFQAGTSCGDDNTDADNLKYTVACLTSLVAILGGVSALYSFNTKMSDNINASGAFANLARRANIQIFLPLHLKAHAEVTLTDISAEYAQLTNTSPLL